MFQLLLTKICMYGATLAVDIETIRTISESGDSSGLMGTINKITGSVVGCALGAAGCFAIMAFAVGVLFFSTGGQREKETGKAKMIGGAIALIISTPAFFFFVISAIQNAASSSSGGSGNGEDKSNSFNITIPMEEADELLAQAADTECEYSVYVA